MEDKQIMIKNFWDKCKNAVKIAVEKLSGQEKREVLARIAEEYGRGGQTFVAKEFNAGRDTIRIGLHELHSGIKCQDAFSARGRKKTTDKLPALCDDIKSIVESQCQTDPKFKSTHCIHE